MEHYSELRAQIYAYRLGGRLNPESWNVMEIFRYICLLTFYLVLALSGFPMIIPALAFVWMKHTHTMGVCTHFYVLVCYFMFVEDFMILCFLSIDLFSILPKFKCNILNLLYFLHWVKPSCIGEMYPLVIWF